MNLFTAFSELRSLRLVVLTSLLACSVGIGPILAESRSAGGLSLVVVEATVLAAENASEGESDSTVHLIQVDRVLEGWVGGSVVLVREDLDTTAVGGLAEGDHLIFFLEPMADGDYQLLGVETPLASNPMAAMAASPRGYSSRPCGFDMDGDGVIGEAGDDCNVCDGSTSDPDGDGIAEDLIYVDCNAGSNGNGSPGNPYNRLSSALAALDGPGDGAEDIVCFKGICKSEALTWPVHGVPGSYKSALTSTVDHDFTLPQHPTMLVGWDADNDGRYPPHDPDDTAIMDGNASGNTSFAIDSAGRDYFELAHFTARDYNLAGAADGGFFDRGRDSNYVFLHDLSLENINKGHGDHYARAVFMMNGGAVNYLTFYNLNIVDHGGYLARGSGCGSECFDWSFINLEAVGYGGPADEGRYDIGGIKFWDKVTNLFLVDSIMDANPDAWDSGGTPDVMNAVNVNFCTKNWTIKNNEIKDYESFVLITPWTNTTDCGGTARNISNVLIDSNIFTNSYAPFSGGDQGIHADGGGTTTTTLNGLTITNNYLSSSTGWEACMWLEVGNNTGANPGSVTVINNTCYGDITTHSAIALPVATSYPEQDWIFKNNIVAGFGSSDIAITVDYAPSNWSADYNVYDNPGTNKFRWAGGSPIDFATWKSRSGGDINSRQCSPTFINEGVFDIHLDSSDTCALNRGTPLTAILSHDIDGDSRPQGSAWDIGADEAIAGGGNSAPGVTISQPANNAQFAEGAQITFSGSASDAEDGNLTSQLAWTSSRDNSIGSGGSFSKILSVGSHVITAQVSDSQGLFGSDAISITIEVVANSAPTIEITSPEPNPALGRPVTSSGNEFADASASKVVDGTADKPNSSWAALGSPNWVEIDLGSNRTIDRVEISPFLGSPGNPYYYNDSWRVQYRTSSSTLIDFDDVTRLEGAGNLVSPGISVVNGDPGDSGSLDAYKYYTFSVRPVTARYLRLTVTGGDRDGDSNGAEIRLRQTFPKSLPIPVTATATDTEDGELADLIIWTSDLDGVLGYGRSTTITDLSVGEHTITAAVTDSSNTTASHSIEISVVDGPLVGSPVFDDGFESGDARLWSIFQI